MKCYYCATKAHCDGTELPNQLIDYVAMQFDLPSSNHDLRGFNLTLPSVVKFGFDLYQTKHIFIDVA